MSRTEKIERRLGRGGRLTRDERTQLWATGRMIDSAAAQIEMLAEDDVFVAAMRGDADDLMDIKRELRGIAQRVTEKAEE